MLTSMKISDLIKIFNSLNYEYTWVFFKGINRSIKDDTKFRKYLKKSFKTTFYYDDKRSVRNDYKF